MYTFKYNNTNLQEMIHILGICLALSLDSTNKGSKLGIEKGQHR